MKISSKLVKELREKTGAGIMDSKKALVENGGNIELAEKWLNENGLLKAAKKSERIAADGLAKVQIKKNTGVIFELNTETDFVAKNSVFLNLLDMICEKLITYKPVDLQNALNINVQEDKTLDEEIKGTTAIIGEKISLRRFDFLSSNGENEVLGSYIHLGGKIAVLVKLSGTIDSNIANTIAMHIAGMAPIAIDYNQIPKELIESKRKEFTNETEKEGKPSNIREKIVEGKLNKYFSTITLLDQQLITNNDIKIRDYLKDIKVEKFIRYFVGEGIEKPKCNFAQEVKEQIG